MAALWGFGIYRYILRHMNERVLLVVVCGVLVSVMTITATNLFLRLDTSSSRGVLVIYAVLACLLLFGNRALAMAACCSARPISSAPAFPS